MVVGVTGVLGLIKDAGLGTVTVQRFSISNEQVSTLFWLNMLLGLILGGATLLVAPWIVSFFNEPRLYWVTVALSAGFVLSAASTQHQALLQRQMRYVAMAAIEIFSLFSSAMVGIAMAAAGCTYWSLVGMAIVLPGVQTVCAWGATKWIPGLPHRNVEARSMLHFGWTVTLTNLVMYIAYNLDKILLGRFWGAGALGLYGRAYQLANMPTEQLNSAVGWIAFPALSRIQDDPSRLIGYFLKGYSLVLALTIPIAIACALFAEDLILVLLGPKWQDASTIFRLFSPTILAFAFLNPITWFLYATGKVTRSLKMALVLAPLVIVSYLAAIPYGPTGIASGFSIMMVLMVVPLIAWARHGTGLASRDILQAVKPPLVSGIVAGILSFSMQSLYFRFPVPYERLALEIAVLFSLYLLVLLYGMKQKETFSGLLLEIRERSSTSGKGQQAAKEMIPPGQEGGPIPNPKAVE
jgi:PST family polysaccharide transporter